MEPTIGRIVHYRLIDSGKVVPAIIVDVQDPEHVDLFLMTSGRHGTEVVEGAWFEHGVRRGDKNGHWEWPSIRAI